MAKSYRREKIVKFAKRMLNNNSIMLDGIIGTARDTELNKAFINFHGLMTDAFVKELCDEFDIKEEEIT